MPTLEIIDRLDALAERYSAILCDVWGVIHNGVEAFGPAVEALQRVKRQGKAVVMITNAPRPHGPVEEQLRSLGVSDDAYDCVVTSGDVTRELISAGPRRIFHIGPDRDMSLYDGLDVEVVEEFEANGIVCTGLYDDRTETPDDYRELLQRLRARNLPMICANPDIVVDRGGTIIYCAGALAQAYGQLGGRTQIAGKPHHPIYEASLAAASRILGREVGIKDARAIGDGVMTDVKGAANMGIDLLFVTDGIHAAEYGEGSKPDPDRVSRFLASHGFKPVAATVRLR
jgi:HAD superfamily hydrolase (TIGR01459 family)